MKKDASEKEATENNSSNKEASEKKDNPKQETFETGEIWNMTTPSGENTGKEQSE